MNFHNYKSGICLKRWNRYGTKGLDIVLTECVDRNVIATRFNRTFFYIYNIAKMSGIGYLSLVEKKERPLGKLDCFHMAGVDLWFNSSDHEPPHFHARKPDKWEIRVFFRACKRSNLVFNVKFPPSG